MTREQGKKEYLALVKKSGLSPSAFNLEAKKYLEGNTNPSIEDWLRAGEQVLDLLESSLPFGNEPELDLPENEKKALDNGEKAFEATKLASTKKVLQMIPYKCAFIATETITPNRRRTVSKDKKQSQILSELHQTEVIVVETTSQQTIINPKEKSDAESLRSKLANQLKKLTTPIIGNLCALPLANMQEFETERANVLLECGKFNQNSTHYAINIIATILEAGVSSEELVARKLNYNIQEGLSDIKKAMNELDFTKVSSITSKLVADSAALAEGTQRAALRAAIEDARKEVSRIKKETKNKGIEVQEYKGKIETSTVNSTRLMFLEYALPEELDGIELETNGASERFKNLE